MMIFFGTKPAIVFTRRFYYQGVMGRWQPRELTLFALFFSLYIGLIPILDFMRISQGGSWFLLDN